MDEGQIRTWLNEFRGQLDDIGKNVDRLANRDSSRDTDTIARAHRDGYKTVANAIQQGFELVAAAIRDSNRR